MLALAMHVLMINAILAAVGCYHEIDLEPMRGYTRAVYEKLGLS